MITFESAHELIRELVKDFKSNEAKYMSASYQEAEVRMDFINRFFEALGWDVYHKEQKNPYEQEVKVEKGVSVGRAQKRADYAFFISPDFRSPKFFAEAKKPSRNLKNADDYFQTIRYGWNANTPVAVLTDFQELHILDCRIKPNINTVLENPAHKSYCFEDYPDKEKFSEIYYLFSRDAVAGGSLEKYSASLAKPKGKIKAGTKAVQAIDEDFLEYIDGIRERLAKAFKKNDESLSSEELTEATQKTIDRLVFIRFLEDKLIEPQNIISEFGRRGDAFKDFISASGSLDSKYNGIVFKEHFIDKKDFKGPNETEFKKICEEFSHLNSPYDFNAIPVHIIGSIYERFLGKVVNATAHRVKVEEKPEVRKAGGVYYTPKYIVDYIVENTVGKIIEGKTPSEISKLRFADIACGSGSFLIGVFETFLKYHTEYYNQNPEQARKDGCIEKDGVFVLSIKQKQKILQNNIYGVDIDLQAVEVTQLSLALKMLEDETTATANEMQVLFHERILPDLSKNIVCGNSLIGTDVLEGKMFGSDEERKLNPMDFETTFPDVFKSGGFDAIVGNPPYGRIDAENISNSYMREKFVNVEFKMDIFSLFVERMIRLKTKYIGIIIPNNLMSNQTERKLRKFILDNTSIYQIVNHKYNVFKDAVIHTMLLFLKYGVNRNNIINIYDEEDIDIKNEFEIPQNKFLIEENYQFNIRNTGVIGDLLNKIKYKTKRLDELCEIKQAIKTGDDDKYIFNEKIGNNYYKVIGGKEMNRYELKYNKRYVYYGSFLACPRNPRIFEVDEKLLIRETGSRITATLDTEKFYLLSSIYSCFKRESEIHNIRYILGILNSRLLQYFMQKVCFDNNIGAFTKARIFHYQQLPIKEINFQSETEKQAHDKIVSLVEQMLEAKKQLHGSKTEKDKIYFERKCDSLDKQIDAEVYKLYGLTEDEIKIVEGASR